MKPENQSKSQEILAKPTPITPDRNIINSAVKWAPAQATPKPKLKSSSSSSLKTNTPKVLLKTPVQSQTSVSKKTPSLTPGKQITTHQQTPVRSQLITKHPLV